MKYLFFVALFYFILPFSCKTKNKSEPLISGKSIVLGQINHIDTSLYQITKYESANSIYDTLYIKREDFRFYANSFILLPDITSRKFSKSYNEEKIIDTEQNTLSIISTAKDESLEIQQQILIIDLNDLTTSNVKSIFIKRKQKTKGGVIHEKLFWQLDSYFQIATITQEENKTEQIKIIKLTWQ